METVKDMGREGYKEHLEIKYADMEDTITDNTRITGVGGKQKDHLYTWERIYHFSCGNCKNWWSYASTEDYKPYVMTCPHCGQMNKIQPIDSKENE